MKRRLLITRHAKSSWKSDAKTDHERPLNKRGQKDAPRIAAHLADNGWIPQVVLSSDAERTRQTWAGMESQLPEVEVIFTRALYHAGCDEFREVVSTLPDAVTSAMVIGHNPGWEEVVEELSGQQIRLTTANVVILDGDGATWAEALGSDWSVAEVIRPKEI